MRLSIADLLPVARWFFYFVVLVVTLRPFILLENKHVDLASIDSLNLIEEGRSTSPTIEGIDFQSIAERWNLTKSAIHLLSEIRNKRTGFDYDRQSDIRK